MICQSTGLQIIAVPLNPAATALYASLDFSTWVGPAIVKYTDVTAFAVAAGKLFMTSATAVYASDSITTGA